MSLTDALRTAVQQTAPLMTAQVRRSAYQSGWPASVGRTLKIEATDTGFEWSADDSAMEWEYGTENRPPAPAVRTYANRTQDAEAAILRNVEAILKQDGVL
jgi:hypothetical protein